MRPAPAALSLQEPQLQGVLPQPVWWQDAPPTPRAAPGEVPATVDVAVVGAGYTGLQAALTLAEAGASVAVFDRGTVGTGASSVNGGQVCPGLKSGGPATLKTFGPELGRALWQASLDAVDELEALIESYRIDCDYDATGGLSLAYRPGHYDRQRQSAAWLAEHLDHEKVPVDPGDLQEEIGSPVFHGALLDHRGGGLHPAKLVHGVADRVAEAGGRIFEGVGVAAIERAAGTGETSGFRLTLERRGEAPGAGTSGTLEPHREGHPNRPTLTAGSVLLATNGYTDGLVPPLARRVLPIGSYMVATEPLSPELCRELSPRGRMFFDTRWFLNYFRLTPDGRMALGGRNDLSTDLPLAESARALRASLVRVYPQLETVPITHTWAGRLGFSFDLLPHLGRLEGIHYAVGYGGHGVALSFHLGRQAARWILGETDGGPFARIPHDTKIYYRGKPWFLPLAARWYRLLDRLG